MRRLLHIVTEPEHPVGERVMALQREQADCTLSIFDLSQPEPDYRALLEEIFQADSIAVW